MGRRGNGGKVPLGQLFLITTEILHEIENELTGDAVERPLLLTDGDGDGRKPDDDYVSDGGGGESD